MTTQRLCESCLGISFPALVSPAGYTHAPLQPTSCMLCDLLVHALETCPCDLEWEEKAGIVQRAAWVYPTHHGIPSVGVLAKRKGLSLADLRKAIVPAAFGANGANFPGPAKLRVAGDENGETPYAVRLWARPIKNAPEVLASYDDESPAGTAEDLVGITVCYGPENVLEKLEQNDDLLQTLEEGRVAVAAPTPGYPGASREAYVEHAVQTHKVHVCAGGLDFKPPSADAPSGTTPQAVDVEWETGLESVGPVLVGLGLLALPEVEGA